MCPIAIPTKSTDTALPSKTENPSSTHGRYGACKTNIYLIKYKNIQLQYKPGIAQLLSLKGYSL